jgi:3-methyl-2-oxobutanoate hydroxymethyltransferase
MRDDRKITPQKLRAMKAAGEKVVALTAYDFFTAQVMDEVGIHLILVGDSLGMAVLGYENTLPVTLNDIVHHTAAVARAKPGALLVADLPFMTYRTASEALESSRQLIRAGAEAIKIEGGATVLPQVRALVEQGIPVLGHVGLLPQSILETGGYKVQGRSATSVEQLDRDVMALEDAGVFGVVIECVVAEVATRLSGRLEIPSIGIGAGSGCDGQILVTNDMLGQFTWFTPKHAKRYANLAEEMRRAFAAYKKDVESGAFPAPEHGFE